MFDGMMRRMRRIALRGLPVAVATAAVAAGLAAAPAQAWTKQNTGCPGVVQVPTTNGYAGLIFEFPQRYAWRSPCYSTSTQLIRIRYRLWAFNLVTRQWVYYTELTRSASADPGYQGTWVSGWIAGSLWANISGDVLVEWRLTNGALIGSTYVNYNSVSDYACQVGSSCKVYPDPTVGAYLHLG